MSLPVIDLAPYVTRQGSTKDIALQIRETCKKIGFFYIKNHGVPEDLQQMLLKNASIFFALPKQIKRKIKLNKQSTAWRGYIQLGEQQTSGKVDLKEGLYFGQQLPYSHPIIQTKVPLYAENLFPNEVPELKASMLMWLKQMDRVGGILAQAVAESLFLHRDFFQNAICKDHLGALRIFHYPYDQEAQKQLWGVGEHTDYGLLTILMMTGKGLQVKSVNNQWIKVDPIPNTFVINIGDFLEKITRGLYKSTPHRVRNTEKKSRYSVPYFYDPSWDAPIKELDLKIDEEQKQILKKNNLYERWDKVKLENIGGTYGDYFFGKASKSFQKVHKL